MGSLDKKTIESIVSSYGMKLENFPCFIETGTHTGKTCERIYSLFREVHTIEISKKYYQYSKNKLSKYNNINCYLGDSIEILRILLKDNKENFIFWLDGHYSGGDTGKGNKDCPVLEECLIINDFLEKTKSKSIILIDDFRLFQSNKDHDWSSISISNIKACFTVDFVEKKDDELDMYQIAIL